MANTSELTSVSSQETYLPKAKQSSTEKLEVYSRGARGSECLSSTKWLTHCCKLIYRIPTVSRAGDGGGSDDVYLPRVRPDEGQPRGRRCQQPLTVWGATRQSTRLTALNKMIECHVSCGRVK